jgi:ribosomal protein S18 acetylase RimI-like enzyme
MDVRIRPIGEEDYRAFAALVEEHPLFAAYELTAGRLAASLAEAAGRGNGVLVAEVNNRPAGLVWFLEEGTFYRSGYLRLLVVSKAHAGKGVGSRLMAAAEARVFAHTTDLFLLVNIANAEAQAFYERLGYLRVGELRDYAAPGLHEYIYRKRSDELMKDSL